MIAFLGTGLLGANFTKALLRKGHKVQVWNRTFAKASALEVDGAVAFAHVTDAVKGAARIHLALKDDTSVDEVLAAAGPALEAGALLIDHTTTSVEGARARTAAWKARGFRYLHAPVFMGPANALEGTGFMMVSGDPGLIAEAAPLLSEMTGKVLPFGPEEGKAAAIKLLGNLFLVAFTAGITDTLSLAGGLQVTPAELLSLFEQWNPGALLPARLQRIAAGNYSKPSWELDMARKDTGLFLQEAERTGVSLAVVPAIAALMDQYIAAGHGREDWTVIGSHTVPGK